MGGAQLASSPGQTQAGGTELTEIARKLQKDYTAAITITVKGADVGTKDFRNMMTGQTFDATSKLEFVSVGGGKQDLTKPVNAERKDMLMDMAKTLQERVRQYDPGMKINVETRNDGLVLVASKKAPKGAQGADYGEETAAYDAQQKLKAEREAKLAPPNESQIDRAKQKYEAPALAAVEKAKNPDAAQVNFGVKKKDDLDAALAGIGEAEMDQVKVKGGRTDREENALRDGLATGISSVAQSTYADASTTIGTSFKPGDAATVNAFCRDYMKALSTDPELKGVKLEFDPATCNIVVTKTATA